MSNSFHAKTLSAVSLICLISSTCSQVVSAAAPTSNKAISPVSKLVVTVDGGNLAKTSHTKVIPKVANVFDDAPFMNGEPEHIETTFDKDKTDESVDWVRKIAIYPISPYAQLFKSRKKEKAALDGTLASLKAIIAKGNADGVKALPMLPAIDCYEIFHNHVHVLNCKNGKGVASVSCYGQDEGPMKNGDFFYTYQGISSDGLYYVSFTYPVKAKKLKDGTEPKPAYALIKGLKQEEFSPSLNEIDRMIQSITFKQNIETEHKDKRKDKRSISAKIIQLDKRFGL